MDIATYTRESARNRQAYEKLRELIRREYADKYVILADGKILGAATSFDDACALVDGLDPVPEYHLVFPANGDPNFDLVVDLAGRRGRDTALFGCREKKGGPTCGGGRLGAHRRR